MVVETPVDVLSVAVLSLGKIALIFQALGIIIILWIIFQIIVVIVNRKNRRRILKMTHDLERIENKLDKIDKKLKK